MADRGSVLTSCNHYKLELSFNRQANKDDQLVRSLLSTSLLVFIGTKLAQRPPSWRAPYKGIWKDSPLPQSAYHPIWMSQCCVTDCRRSVGWKEKLQDHMVKQAEHSPDSARDPKHVQDFQNRRRLIDFTWTSHILKVTRMLKHRGDSSTIRITWWLQIIWKYFLKLNTFKKKTQLPLQLALVSQLVPSGHHGTSRRG